MKNNGVLDVLLLLFLTAAAFVFMAGAVGVFGAIAWKVAAWLV